MATIPREKWRNVSRLYLSGKTMRQVAEAYDAQIGAVVYILRKLKVPRRSATEANNLLFESKKPSFFLRRERTKALDGMGAMLYWAEGYKTEAAMGIDFANSDPRMAKFFVTFLRDRYDLDEKRLRGMIYCYADQDIPSLTKFWSSLLDIPQNQFTRPYVRTDFRINGRKIPYGTVHIRYSDKKMLRDMLNLIESYKKKYASVG